MGSRHIIIISLCIDFVNIKIYKIKHKITNIGYWKLKGIIL